MSDSAAEPESSGEGGLDQPRVTVLVEAPVMTDSEPSEVVGKSCSPDIELQTADTQQLPSVAKEPNAIVDGTHSATTDMPDVLLDLEEITTSESSTDDFILDLDTEIIPPDELSSPVALPTAEEHLEVAEIVEVEPIAEFEVAHVEAEAITSASTIESTPQAETTAISQQPNLAELSPKVVEAIARRVVEQLSDKVVRDIAWEVVPELAELLIKQRLDEQNR